MKSGVYFLFLFIAATPVIVYGQNTPVQAIEIGFSGTTGNAALPALSSFLNNTREPGLFRTENISDINKNEAITKNGFQIQFQLNDPKRPRIEWLAGIDYATVDYTLYEFSGTLSDTLNTTGTLTANNEYFFLHSGFHFVTKPESRFTWILGAYVNVGFPVSAKTEETIVGEDFQEYYYSFFGKRSVTTGITAPIGFRFKVINNFSLSLLTKPTLQYYRIDGSPVTAKLSSIDLGFHFKLRGRE